MSEHESFKIDLVQGIWYEMVCNFKRETEKLVWNNFLVDGEEIIGKKKKDSKEKWK